MTKILITTCLCLAASFCICQTETSTNFLGVKKGTLLFFLGEAYFFPVHYDSLEQLPPAKELGLKLPFFEFADIFENIATVEKVTVYVASQNNQIDTVQTTIGIIHVKIKTRKTKTKLSNEQGGFNLLLDNKKWVEIIYEYPFDLELLYVKPHTNSDKKKFKNYPLAL